MKILKSIANIVLGSLTVVILFELFLRYTGILSPVVIIHENKGERYARKLTCSSLFVSEGFGLSKTNNFGWFESVVNSNHPQGLSVAFFGNSFVAGRQVFSRHHFISIAKRRFSEKCKNTPVSFYNYGKEDIDLSELLYILESEAEQQCKPNYTVVVLNEAIFRKNRKRLVSYYEYKSDTLLVNKDFKNSTLFKLYRRFYFLSQSSVAFLLNRSKNKWPNAKEIFFDNLHENKENNKPVSELLSLMSASDSISLKRLDKKRNVLFILDLNKSDERKVREVITQSPILNLKPYINIYEKRMGTNIYYWPITNQVGHWNHDGHELIGKISGNLLAQILRYK